MLYIQHTICGTSCRENKLYFFVDTYQRAVNHGYGPVKKIKACKRDLLLPDKTRKCIDGMNSEQLTELIMGQIVNRRSSC